MKTYKILLLVFLGALFALTGVVSASAWCGGYYPCGNYFYQYRPAISWQRPTYHFPSIFGYSPSYCGYLGGCSGTTYGGYGGYGGNYGGYGGWGGNYGGYGWRW